MREFNDSALEFHETIGFKTHFIVHYTYFLITSLLFFLFFVIIIK